MDTTVVWNIKWMRIKLLLSVGSKGAVLDYDFQKVGTTWEVYQVPSELKKKKKRL